MSTQNQSDCQNALGTVEDIIRAIEKKTADGDYIFRGESQCYEKVCSGLYRELRAVKVNYSDIADVQTEIVRDAKTYTDKTDDFAILAELQHYGGKTNLIDFTTNYKVALFFSCYGHPDKPGRVIILQKTETVKKMLKYPRNSVKRAVDQDSVFIQPPNGFIEPDNEDIINIPKDLKLLILDHLRGCPDREISPKTIYNDIHGFIRSQNYYWMAYREFYEGLIWKDKGDEAKVPSDKQKIYIKSVNHYTKALEHDLQQAAVYNNRGNIYSAMGEIDKAINDLNKAIELKSDYANAYNNRGDTYRKKGDFDKAINDYNRAIELKSDFAEAYSNRGVAYRDRNDLPKALEDYNTAIRLNPNFAEAYNNRGNVYRSIGDLPKAFEDYNTVIRLKPDFAEAYNNRGIAYGIKDQVDKAIADFDKAIGLDPAFADAYCNRGNAYLLKGDLDKAIEDYSRSIKYAPKDAMSYSNRGVAYLRKGEVDKTIEDASKAIELDGKLSNAYYNRAEAWLRLKEWDKAKSDLTTAQKLGMDIVAAFHNNYKNVETYAQWQRVRLPEDIAHMLTQPLRVRFPKQQKIVSADGTPLESSNVVNLREQLRNTGTPLSTYLKAKPSFGIKTSPTEAFVVDRKTRDNLIAAHPSSANILKPFLRGRDLRRWHAEPQEKWLIFAHRRIAINEYPAILKHLENHKDSLLKRSSKQEWYELPISLDKSHQFSQPKLVCPNLYNHQTFAVDTAGFYCGDTCYLIPTEELWLCGLLNSGVVEWFYSQESNQLTIDYLWARSGYMQQIPIPDITSTQKALIGQFVDYLIYLQQQPTIKSKDLAYARDREMLGYFERIIDGMVYESYLPNELHESRKHLFQPLFDERLPQLEEIRGDKMSACRDIFERLYEKTHPVAVNLFFLDSVKPVRIIEGKL